MVTVVSKYHEIYLSHDTIDSFLDFSIKLRCYIIRNNLFPSTLTDNDVKRFKKQYNCFVLNDCKSMLGLDGNDDDAKIYNTGVKPIIKKKVNVIVSAYRAQDFIEECLDSIAAQSYGYHKILLGIDGCKKTLNAVKLIMHKYQRLEVRYSDKNHGVYLMFNSLIDLVPDDQYILMFGADDIMNVDMIESLCKYKNPVISRHCGVLLIKKLTFNTIGGFMPWRCGADMDSLNRLKLAGITVSKAPLLFFRRVHENQLTIRADTNFDSDLRKSYIKFSNDNLESQNPIIKIEPQTIDLISI